MQPIQFLEYLNSMIMSNQEDEADLADEKECYFNIIIHKQKLSFKYVIIPNFDKDIDEIN